MWNDKRVSVVLMTYAERDSIRSVIEDFFGTGLVDEVLVVDNNAEPGTAEEVRRTPARLVHEPRQGYGHATRRGLLEASGDLALRLGTARLPAGGDTWERGVPADWLARLIEDWQAFDPLTLQARLDRLTHLRAEVDGVSVHLVHAPGTGPDPLPLVLTHGWPSSFLEYLTLLPMLTDPAAHGGDAADAFSVVLPSLPGFGFSGPPPPGGLLHQQVAELWHEIMTGALGYRRYAAHGDRSFPWLYRLKRLFATRNRAAWVSSIAQAGR